MSTLGDLQTHVRAVLDVDSTDLPDAVLNVWLQDGYNRQIAMEQRWPFFETSTTFAATAGTRAYAVSSIDPDLRSVSAIFDDGTIGMGYQLRLVRHDDIQARMIGGLDTPSQPMFYSKRGSQIHLWPKPDQAYSYIVLGYRAPTDWILDGSGGSPDSDSRLHLAMADWAIARYFHQQEDAEMAMVYEQAFKDGTSLAHDAIMAVDEEYPLIMGRGMPVPSHAWWMQSLGRNLGV